MTTPIDPVHLPPDIEGGSSVGPQFATTIIPLSSGGESRNADWDQEMVRADISYGMMSDDNAMDPEDSFKRIQRFFRARMGRHRGFLFRDPSDFEASNERMYSRFGSARNFQLSKTYDGYKRRITRPVADTLIVYANGEILPKAGNGVAPAWALDPLGLVVFSADVSGGVILTASFDFDIPMRFDSDYLPVTVNDIRSGSIPEVSIVQVTE